MSDKRERERELLAIISELGDIIKGLGGEPSATGRELAARRTERVTFWAPVPILDPFESFERIAREAFMFGTTDKVLVCSDRDNHLPSMVAGTAIPGSLALKPMRFFPRGQALFLDKEVWGGLRG